MIIDVAILWDLRIKSKENEKIEKYRILKMKYPECGG